MFVWELFCSTTNFPTGNSDQFQRRKKKRKKSRPFNRSSQSKFFWQWNAACLHQHLPPPHPQQTVHTDQQNQVGSTDESSASCPGSPVKVAMQSGSDYLPVKVAMQSGSDYLPVKVAM